MIAEAITSTVEAANNWHILKTIIAIASPLAVAAAFLWKQSNPDKVNIQQPLKVDVLKDMATKEELRAHRDENIREQNKLEQRMTQIERKMETDKTEIIAAGSERGKHIYDRIGGVLTGIERISTRLGRVEGRLKITTLEE